MSLAAEVIVVGSGPAGIAAAWPLVLAGVQVLMIDASDGTLPPAPAHDSLAAWRADPRRWRAELGTDTPIDGSGASPKLATPLAQATLSGFAAALRITADDYAIAGSLAAGGLSNVWGALAVPYSDRELADFPGGAAALSASYTRVTERIGLSHGSGASNGSGMQPTPPIARLLARRLRRHSPADVTLMPAPNAVLAEDRADRQACNACGLCLHGCSRGSIYQSAAELPALRRHANFRYRPGIMVERLSGGPGAHVVEGRAGRTVVRFAAGHIVLAAGTLATSGLALRRLGLTDRPVRLLGNPVGGAAFVIPSLIGAALPSRSFALAQLLYTLEAAPGVEAVGALYGADTLPLAPIADRLPFTRPTALRVARALAPALVLATAYLPGRYSDHHYSVGADSTGGRIRIDGRQSPEAAPLLHAAFRKLCRELRARGAWFVPGSINLLPPGSDAHPTSTLPMGGQGAAATTARGMLRSIPGIYIADGASLPSLSARHPTLTIMANADRIGTLLAQRLLAQVPHAHAG